MSKHPMTISITGGPKPESYEVKTVEGETIKGIRSIEFTAGTNEVPTATLNIICPNMSLWEVNASVPLDQLITLAKAHGYLLVPDAQAYSTLNYATLRSFVRLHGYDLISCDGFHEEP
jgi:hypothetical protein